MKILQIHTGKPEKINKTIKRYGIALFPEYNGLELYWERLEK